jgi:hypothetical protein
MAGENYTFQMPTEELKGRIEDLKAKLARAEAALLVSSSERCPDPECPNCQRWLAWEQRNGDVLWLQCTACTAPIGHPCRHVGRGAGRSYGNRPPILKRPHRDRPWVEKPDAPLV